MKTKNTVEGRSIRRWQGHLQCRWAAASCYSAVPLGDSCCIHPLGSWLGYSCLELGRYITGVMACLGPWNANEELRLQHGILMLSWMPACFWWQDTLKMGTVTCWLPIVNGSVFKVTLLPGRQQVSVGW